MKLRSLVFTLFFTLFSPVFSDDFYQVRACCLYGEDVEYIVEIAFNKQNMMEYNSTRGKWIGFTVYSALESHIWNRDPYDTLRRAYEKKSLCDDQKHIIQTLGNFTVTPTIRIKSVRQADGRHPAMLVCSTYDFYPKQIRVTWLRNDQKVTEGVSYSDVMSDGQLYFQFHSHLEYTPSSGEKIICMVEHPGLSEPQAVVWDNSFAVEEQLQIVVGLCGLMLGLLILSSGFIYYKKTSAAYTATCQRGAMIPVEDLTAAQTKPIIVDRSCL